jgi:hypothetical protein
LFFKDRVAVYPYFSGLAAFCPLLDYGVKFAGGHDPGRLALPARDESDAGGESEDGDPPAGRDPWEQETPDATAAARRSCRRARRSSLDSAATKLGRLAGRAFAELKVRDGTGVSANRVLMDRRAALFDHLVGACEQRRHI